VNPVAAARLAEMLAQQLPRFRIEQTNPLQVPLHLHAAADPQRRGAVVSGLDFDAAVQVHGALAVLVVAEWFQRQRLQGGLLFGKHGRYLPLGRAVNPRVGPALLPVIQISLCLLQAFETLSLEWCSLGVSDSGLDFPLVESHRMQVVWETPQAGSE